MTLTYETQTMSGMKWYRCTAEGREYDPLGSTLKRGVSSWHPTKGMAKSDALASLESVTL